MMIQYIAGQSFYSISNMNMMTALNAQFNQLYSQFGSTTFPFQISVLTLTINYPPDSFPVNNTLGIQLLKAKSLLSQLSNQYDTINAYITNNIASINTTYVQNVSFLYKFRLPSQLPLIVAFWGLIVLMIGWQDLTS